MEVRGVSDHEVGKSESLGKNPPGKIVQPRPLDAKEKPFVNIKMHPITTKSGI